MKFLKSSITSHQINLKYSTFLCKFSRTPKYDCLNLGQIRSVTGNARNLKIISLILAFIDSLG